MSMHLAQTAQPPEQFEFTSRTYDPPGARNWLFGHAKGVRVTHKSGVFEQCHSERGFRANQAAALERLKDRMAADAADNTHAQQSSERETKHDNH